MQRVDRLQPLGRGGEWPCPRRPLANDKHVRDVVHGVFDVGWRELRFPCESAVAVADVRVRKEDVIVREDGFDVRREERGIVHKGRPA